MYGLLSGGEAQDPHISTATSGERDATWSNLDFWAVSRLVAKVAST